MSLRTPRHVSFAVLSAMLIMLSVAATHYQAQVHPGRSGAYVPELVSMQTKFAQSQPSQTALADIPANFLALYRSAALTCPTLDWSVLAGIGKIETDHGRSQLPGVGSGENFAGAGGPMQFLQPTFESVVSSHTIPPGGAAPPSRYNPHDAIFAAADYLCDSGASRGDLNTAILTYNHSQQYVDDVMARAQSYAGNGGAAVNAGTSVSNNGTPSSGGTTDSTSTASGTAGAGAESSGTDPSTDGTGQTAQAGSAGVGDGSDGSSGTVG